MTATVARPKGPFFLAIGLGAVTSLGLLLYLQQLKQDQASETLVPLVVAARPVAAETKLSAADLKIRQVPQRLFPAAGLQRVEAAADRICRTPLFPDDPLQAAKLYPLGSDGGMTFTIPAGKRAVTLAVDEVTGVAGFVKPGNRVDVIGAREDRGNGSARAQVVVQNLPVLAVAQDRDDRNGRQAKLVSSVTLMATPREAELLTLASEQGKIRLALRATGDNAVVRTIGVPWPERTSERAPERVAVTQPAAPVANIRPVVVKQEVPVKPATAPLRSFIEVIRGTHRDVTGG